MFVTTTVLGYTPIFRNPSRRRKLLSLLVEECRFFGAVLHAYCVMDHHLHLILRAPEAMTMSKFMQGFKARTAKALLPDLTPFERRRLKEAEKDGRALWMRSFRGIRTRREEVFWRCITYVHLNPVRAGLCERAIDYEWSSAAMFEVCHWTEDEGVLPWMRE